MLNHPDRLFPADPAQRAIARELYAGVKDLKLVSPHGHTDPAWFAKNEKFTDPAQLLIVPDHYVFRMLCSKGIALERLGVATRDGTPVEKDGRNIWRLFAENYYLFRGTPTRLWLDHALENLFGIETPLAEKTADASYDRIADCLARDEFRPRALFEKFNLEVIATTESPLDSLEHHKAIRDSGWKGRVITSYRPDNVVDPDFEGFAGNLDRFGEITGCDTGGWQGYLEAHRKRRTFFREMGATSTDHGHPTAATENLSPSLASALFDKVRSGKADFRDNAQFRAQMLTEMAKMSVEDRMVMQVHPGAWRDHSDLVLRRFGRDKGFDIPKRTDYVTALKPLLDAVGLEPNLTLILFTLDESPGSIRACGSGRLGGSTIHPKA